MTGAELRATRLLLNLTLSEMAKALRCGVRSLERLEGGTWTVTNSQALLADIYRHVPGALEFALKKNPPHEATG